jgi:hypothetical protein
MSNHEVDHAMSPRTLGVELTIAYTLGERCRFVATIPAPPGPIGIGMTQDEAREGVLHALADQLGADSRTPPEGPTERISFNLPLGPRATSCGCESASR